MGLRCGESTLLAGWTEFLSAGQKPLLRYGTPRAPCAPFHSGTALPTVQDTSFYHSKLALRTHIRAGSVSRSSMTFGINATINAAEPAVLPPKVLTSSTQPCWCSCIGETYTALWPKIVASHTG